jgi:hypothetical protein
VFQRRCCVAAATGAGTLLDTRRPASFDHPRCRESATYVHDPGHCEPPAGRRRNRTVLGCEVRSRAVRSSPADRIWGEEKIFCCVTTRGCNFWVLNNLGRDLGSMPAFLLGLGMLHFDVGVLATFSLAASCLPAADLPQAFRVLAIALVPASWLVLASASLAQADPWARSPRSGQTAVSLRNVKGAHGSGYSQGKARGECWLHSPRALSQLEQDANLPVYRFFENKTERQTISSTRREQDPPALITKRSSSREQDPEINGLITRQEQEPGAAVQTIKSAAGSRTGPTSTSSAHRDAAGVAMRVGFTLSDLHKA